MEISYLGHSAFKIKTKSGTLVTDPYGSSVGFAMQGAAADIVTISHRGHGDHEEVGAVTGTARRKQPFVIDSPGEYEVEGISVFGYRTWHDDKGGAERGPNNLFVIQAEDLRILHLGDLGHKLESKLLEELDGIDVLMIPVGGKYTIDAKTASELAREIDPSLVCPMHYRTDKHDQKLFGQLSGVDEFVKEFGQATRKVKSLNVSKLSLPEDVTEVILFEDN